MAWLVEKTGSSFWLRMVTSASLWGSDPASPLATPRATTPTLARAYFVSRTVEAPPYMDSGLESIRRMQKGPK
jgi:hypothetical protein